MTLLPQILASGKIKRLYSSRGSGTTGEAHLAKYKNKKYLLRICPNEETAKRYINYYKKFRKYKFFPKLLEESGKYLLFKFIEGGETREDNEDKKTIYQIGKICAIINKSKANYDYKTVFLRKLKIIKEKNILNEDKIKEIECFYKKSKAKLKTSLDAGDVTNDNFVRGKNKKIYFVDIEAIKPNIKGFGIAKAYSSWFKKEDEREAFEKGYNSVSSMKFFNKDYNDLCTLVFLVHRIKFKFEKGEKRLVEISIMKLNRILCGKWVEMKSKIKSSLTD